jgi:hypothetical protein
VAGLLRGVERTDELALRVDDPPGRDHQVRTADGAEGEERDVRVPPHERLDDLAPLGEALGVTRKLAGDDELAAHFSDRLQVVYLAARRDRERLVEPQHSCLELAQANVSKAELGQRVDLEIDLAEPPREVERLGGVFRGHVGIGGAPSAHECQQSVLHAERESGQLSLGAGQPPVRRGRVPQH